MAGSEASEGSYAQEGFAQDGHNMSVGPFPHDTDSDDEPVRDRGCAMAGWVQMETYDVAAGPSTAVLFKERWFELWGTYLIHFSTERAPGHEGHPGDVLDLSGMTTAPTLSMKFVLQGKTAYILHSRSPGDWLPAIMQAVQEKEHSSVLAAPPQSAHVLSNYGEYTIKQLKLTADATLCSFGSLRRATLEGHDVAARLITPKYLLKPKRAEVTPDGELDLSAVAAATMRCKYLNSVHFTATTRPRGGAAAQSWVVADWLPHPLRGKVGERRARHQLAQLAIAVAHLEKEGQAPHGGVHPSKVRLDQQHNAVLTGVGLKTLYTDARRRTAEQAPYHSARMCDDDWYSLGGVLYFLLSGTPPQWTATDASPRRGRAVALPLASAACCAVLDGLLSSDHDTRICSVDGLRQMEWFEGFDWDFCGGVPVIQAPPPVFRVVELESPHRRFRVGMRTAGTSVGGIPTELTRKAPPRADKRLAKPTLSSSERTVEAVAKALALKQVHTQAINPPMKYTIGVPGPKEARRVQTRRDPVGVSQPRNCAVDLVPSAHATQLTSLKVVEAHKAASGRHRSQSRGRASRAKSAGKYPLVPRAYSASAGSRRGGAGTAAASAAADSEAVTAGDYIRLADPRKPSYSTRTVSSSAKHQEPRQRPISVRSPPKHYEY